MITHIDWLSFTLPVEGEGDIPSHRLFEHLANIVNSFNPLVAEHLFLNRTYVPRAGRAPYSIAWTDETGGVTMFGHPAIPHFLIEVSGRECELLGETAYAADFLAAVQPRLTRIDIACDMLTETRPDAFALQREPGRFKAWSEVVSASGHTIYVGSRESDRYARVYRYNPPHPRSHLLRSEFVLKAEQARLAAATILADGMDSYSAALGNTFGWTHPDWQTGISTSAEASAWRPERRQGKTVRWVYAQVLPSLLKLHKDGTLDIRKLFENEILPRLEE